MDDLDKARRTLGAALLAARQRAGLTQSDVATQVGLPLPLYARIESGLMWPSVPLLQQLCEALRLSVSEVLGLGVPEDGPPLSLHELARTLVEALSPEELRAWLEQED
jgi:transcriptional regulator with XRE-family HTH domain